MKSILLPSLLLSITMLSACGSTASNSTHEPSAQTGTLSVAAEHQPIPIPSTPQSWDYRIARVISNSPKQVVNQDTWGASSSSITSLHSYGKKVICYFSAGTWESENYTQEIINKALTDYTDNGIIDGSGDPEEAQAVGNAILNGEDSYEFNGQFRDLSVPQLTFKSLVGPTLPGWETERVYLINDFDAENPTPEHTLLRGLMQGHMTEAASIGCDALEPDNIDIYAQEELADLGITSEMQYAYNTWLAEAAHEMNQKIYLKNDLDQIADGGEEVPEGERGLAYIFDGLINESCFTYTECEKASPFRDQGKPIFVREYNVADCTAFRRKQIEYKTGYKSIQQIANELHLNVSASRYENGGNPDTGGRDANAYAPLCTFGTW